MRPIGETVKITTEVPTLEGYDFIEWRCTDNDGKVWHFHPGDNYRLMYVHTLWAVWGNKVTYNINDKNAVRGELPESFVRLAGETVKLSTKTPMLDGYEFLGWKCTDNENKDHVFLPGDEYRLTYVHTLWALWGNQVLYNANGGSQGKVPDSFTKYRNYTIHLTMEVPMREGYDFLGWAKKSDATKADYYPGDEFSENQITTLYAVWKESDNILKLPNILTVIEEDAFRGVISAEIIEIPDSIEQIQKKAFADNKELKAVYIYGEKLVIADDAFENCTNITVYGYEGSDVERYCKQKSIPFHVIISG